MTTGAIPLADLGRLKDAARRTRRLRLLAAGVVVGAAALALVVSLRTHPRATAFLPQASS